MRLEVPSTQGIPFLSRLRCDTGMADGVAVGYDRLDEMLASAGSRK